MSSFLKTAEYRAIIKFFIQKGLNATEISKKLNSVYKDNVPSCHTVVKWVTAFKEPERDFEDSPGMNRPSTNTTNENIEAVEWIIVRDWQISVRRRVYELPIPITTVYKRL